MGLSIRRFLIGNDDAIYRLANMKFDRMARQPYSEAVPIFCGQRVRMAEVLIELDDRAPVRICRESFAILEFDSQGRLDIARFEKQQFALASVTIDAALAVPDPTSKVVNAADRFVAHGGSWMPKLPMKIRIEKAALGQLACRSV